MLPDEIWKDIPGSKTKVNEKDVLENIKKSSHVLEHQTALSPLFDRIGDARIVMLGEASHGTHEFYTWRTTSHKG